MIVMHEQQPAMELVDEDLESDSTNTETLSIVIIGDAHKELTGCAATVAVTASVVTLAAVVTAVVVVLRYKRKAA
eukprot:scaffold368985_cov37-Prasinocladus_malaysianus.AAC.1